MDANNDGICGHYNSNAPTNQSTNTNRHYRNEHLSSHHGKIVVVCIKNGNLFTIKCQNVTCLANGFLDIINRGRVTYNCNKREK